jgi:WD40 repeat protein
VAAVWGTGEIVLDLYRVERVIHSGGMGIVYQVRHLGWDVDLAVKAPRPELVATDGGRLRFEREAESWVGLGLHPHTVSCAYVRRHEGVPLVFAEWIDGGSLAEAIGDRRLHAGGPVLPRLLDVAIQFAWGLRHAHAAGLIHQDLKPANVLMTTAGTVKITDFGLARARALAGETSEAPPGATAIASYGGRTPAYCSPEQARAAQGAPVELTRATDVWSWALTVLELFAGRRLTSYGQAAAEVFEAWLAGDPHQPGMPAAVADLLRACFQADPARRTVRMDDAVRVLRDAYAAAAGRPYPRPEPSAARLRADGLNNHALTLLDLGRTDEARHSWEEALRVEPHHRHAVFNLGLHQWRAGEITDGTLADRLRASAAAHRDDPADAHLLGLVLLEGGDAPGATELLASAARRAPGEPEFAAALRRAEAVAPGAEIELGPHEHPVKAMAITPDGRFVATAAAPWNVTPDSPSGIVQVWHTADGSRTCRVEATTSLFPSLAISADGSTVACGTRDRAVLAWDAATGRLLARIEPAADVAAAALSPDGALLAIAAESNALGIWETATGRARHTLQRPAAFAAECRGLLRFSPDGRILYWANTPTARVRSWAVDRGMMLNSYPLAGRPPAGCPPGTNWGYPLLSADGATAVVTWPTGAEVWDVAAGRRLRTGPAIAFRTSGTVSADGAYALTPSGEGAELWNLAQGRRMRLLATDDPVALSADGSVGVAGRDAVRVGRRLTGPWPAAPWALDRPRPAEALTFATTAVRRLLAEADAAVSGPDARPRIAAALREARSLPGHRRDASLLDRWAKLGRSGRRTALLDAWPVRDLTGPGFGRPESAWAYDQVPAATGRVAVTADGRTAVTVLSWAADIWDLPSGEIRATLGGHEGDITAHAVGDGRALAVTAGHDGTLRVWSLLDGTCRHVLPFPGAAAHSVEVVAAGRIAVTTHQDGFFRLWDLIAGREIGKPPGARRRAMVVRYLNGQSPRAVLPSADGTVLLVPESRGAFTVVDVETGRHRPGPGAAVADPRALSPHGRTALLREWTGRAIWTWDVASGELGHRLTGHTAEVTVARFTADGRTALTAGHDGPIRVWDVASGRCRHVLGGHLHGVSDVHPVGDRFVFSAGADNVVRVWDLETGRALRELGSGTELTAGSDPRYVVVRDEETSRLWELDWDFDFPANGTNGEGAR